MQYIQQVRKVASKRAKLQHIKALQERITQLRSVSGMTTLQTRMAVRR